MNDHGLKPVVYAVSVRRCGLNVSLAIFMLLFWSASVGAGLDKRDWSESKCFIFQVSLLELARFLFRAALM